MGGWGGLQQPAGQFSTGNWWPQRGGGGRAWSGERWAGLKRVRGILGSASRQRGLSLGSSALVSTQNCTCGSAQTADLNLFSPRVPSAAFQEKKKKNAKK